MNQGRPDQRQSKNQRREAAREKARILREEQARRESRNRILLFTGLGVVVVAILVGIGLIIASAIKPPGPGPANMASDGIVIGEGLAAVRTPALEADAEPIPTPVDTSSEVVAIRIYVDYMCPFCGMFEQTNIDQITQWVESGAATLEIHPLSFLDRASLGTKYSTRAANAVACVANYSPDNAFTFSSLLFRDQPSENTEGLSNDKLKELAAEAGAQPTETIDTCINDQQFKGWVADATQRAGGPIPNSSLEGITATPTVLVNGQQFKGSIQDADAFASFVLQVAGDSYTESTSTPVPTSTPTPTP